MSVTLASGEVYMAESVEEATSVLAELGEEGAPLAGGTWIMRAPLRGQTHQRSFVSLSRLTALRQLTAGDDVHVGALVTHTELATLSAGTATAGLVRAAALSAFPQVRNVATVAGNLAATGFAEADLVPALLAADAEVEVAAGDQTRYEPLEDYLASRTRRPAGELITNVRVPAPPGRRSGFERLTVRASGEYAIANVAVCVDVDHGVVQHARLAVGSVDERARLCDASALVGQPAGDAEAARAAGEAAAAELTARDGLDAPGWYRLAVLPALVQRACAQVRNGAI